MLVLTRKSEEEIIIDDGNGNVVVITVLKIQGDKVSIGIKAPPKTQIWRKELLEGSVKSSSQKCMVGGATTMAQTIHDLQIDVSGNKTEKTPTVG